MPRFKLTIEYAGTRYSGWQAQRNARTVQGELNRAIAEAIGDDALVDSQGSGRTDAGVHAINQVVHFDTDAQRATTSWVRGVNRYLPDDIAVQWCVPVGDAFHARNAALGRRYRYIVLESMVRPALETGFVGWVFQPLDAQAMRAAALALIGEHDFSAFRAAECQATSPVKTLRAIEIARSGAYWRFDFDASAFLHHMVRNIIGSLMVVGHGEQPREWIADVLAARDRTRAGVTGPPEGLVFIGPRYDRRFGLPDEVSL